MAMATVLRQNLIRCYSRWWSDRKVTASQGHGFPLYKVAAFAEHEATDQEILTLGGTEKARFDQGLKQFPVFSPVTGKHAWRPVRPRLTPPPASTGETGDTGFASRLHRTFARFARTEHADRDRFQPISARKIEPIEVHHFGPRRYEVFDELLLSVAAGVHFRKSSKLRIRTEHQIDG